jgi:HK97 family phage prohead protease
MNRASAGGEVLVRAYPAVLETRGVGAGLVRLTGYASTFGQPYEINDAFGPYLEQVRHGAFTDTLSAGADVNYLANHAGLTMARTGSGSLRLTQDSRGLHVEATVNPNRSDVRDLLAAIEDGDVADMSFAFRVTQQQWSPDYDQRDLLAVDLHRGDVSAVNFGANPHTTVSVGS